MGYRDLYENIYDEIKAEVERMVEENNVKKFLVGDNGSFDRIAAGAVRSIKHEHSDIRLYLVISYSYKNFQKYRKYYEMYYDKIVFPEKVSGVNYNTAILKRNQWMIIQVSMLYAIQERISSVFIVK